MKITNLSEKVNFVNKHGLRTNEVYAIAKHKHGKEFTDFPPTFFLCVSIQGTRYLIDLHDGIACRVKDHAEDVYFQEVNAELIIKD